jgi:photosystem II stability/assembly factor-like uncharacterized protein
MHSRRFVIALTLAAAAVIARPQLPHAQAAKANLHLYLLIGQSNMAGRGVVEAQDQTPHPRVLMFTKQNVWAPAVDPLHFDKPIAGVSLGSTFGRVMADADPQVTIGLIPSAVGGTALERWQKGADLYERAVGRAKAAMRDGTLKGILWHQGESDSGNEKDARSYGERVARMVSDLRAELGAGDVPFVAGQLGEFALRDDRQPAFLGVVDAQIEALSRRIPRSAVVSARGLTHKGDRVHFDSPSLRELGRRYASALMELTRPARTTASVGAQSTSAPAPASRYAAYFGSLRWRSIGPLRGGRSITAAGSAKRPLEYYFGATGGGVWKTTDGGVTWQPIADAFLKTSSPGALAVSESNPDIVYVGMGETELRGNVIQGDGVYKSTDAGKTWTKSGLDQTQSIARIRIHPANPDLVFVAAFGNPYGPNPERGIFRSKDGGKAWEKVLFRNDKVGASDLIFDPKNPDVMYAALWEAYRTPYGLEDGGPGGGLFKSTDGGSTWKELTKNPGLPKNDVLGKITVAVSGGDSNRLFAMVEARDGGLFRSDDGGATWTSVNRERRLWQRAFYFIRMTADPVDRDTIYVQNFELLKSTDAGKTFKDMEETHSDHHDLWIAPNDPRRMINSNDGGASVSTNGGLTWTNESYATGQFYNAITTAHVPYHVCGAQQDNTTACTPSNAIGRELYSVGGGESGYVAPDPANQNIFYAGSFGGYLTRLDRSTGQTRFVNVWPEYQVGQAPRDLKERFQWTFPIVFSPVNPKILYASSQHLFRTTNEGQTWEAISPDLTRHDPKTMGPSGGPIAFDQTGVETYPTIFTVAPSRLEADTIWTGSDDGLAQITRDAGKNWTNVTPPDLPEFSRISLIEASPHKAGTAYLAANRYQLSDRSPYVFRTDDYGKTWTKIVNGIPGDDFPRAIREDAVRQGLLFLGTERGVYVSFDNGGAWEPLRVNLPVTPVHGMVVQGNDLVIGTHGRGFWVMDNISVLRQLTPAVTTEDVHLFVPPAVTRTVQRGVGIDYFLKTAADRLTLEFLDASGSVVRTVTEPAPQDTEPMPEGVTESSRAPIPRVPAKAGMNRFVWDLRSAALHDFPGLIMYQTDTRGPVVPPGRYQVRLSVAGRTLTQPIVIGKDARQSAVTDADLQEQYRFAREIGESFSQTSDMVVRIRRLKVQIADRVKGLTDSAAILSAAEKLAASLTAVEGELYQYQNRSTKDPLNFPPRLNNKIAVLLSTVDSGDFRPTDQSYEVFKDLTAKLAAQKQALDTVFTRDVAAFNAMLARFRRPPVTP